MPAPTKTKGDIGQVKVMGDLLVKGYKVALPLGEDWRYDLIVDKDHKLLRIQCKYVEARNGFIKVRCETHDGRNYYKYRREDLDYIAVYDEVSKTCYYISNSYINGHRASINLRFTKPKNNQEKKILYAKDFINF